jgi:hypothetical protein
MLRDTLRFKKSNYTVLLIAAAIKEHANQREQEKSTNGHATWSTGVLEIDQYRGLTAV